MSICSQESDNCGQKIHLQGRRRKEEQLNRILVVFGLLKKRRKIEEGRGKKRKRKEDGGERRKRKEEGRKRTKTNRVREEGEIIWKERREKRNS